MKLKNITVRIKPLEDGLKEFVGAVKDAQRGRFPKKPVVGTDFVSMEALRNVLTPKRVQLLQLIRSLEPDSIYELALAADRDLKNVQDDVALLAGIELISLSRSRTRRGRVIPRVEYDRLQLQIPMV